MNKSINVVWHHATVIRYRREQQNSHYSAVLRYTSLSGAGKSTLVHAVKVGLYFLGCLIFVLNSDNIRHGL
ncbi:adenylylsulfate kinase [Nitrosomonas sp. Nm33]|nr:adenylylsulfate kinase [Nitrosomonas sp. Nm33]